MKIRKVAVGNAAEAFIEGNFTNGVNIISSDDNNKGKTIVIQSMMYALGNEPTFPTSFEFQKYYYYIEFEEAGIIFKLCRSGDGFVLKRESTVLIFDNVSELKRYWNRNIFPLPSIAKNQLLRIVDPVLYVQLFFIAAQIMGPHSSASCPVPNGWNLLTDMCRGGGLFQLDLEGTSSQRRSFL